MAEGIERWRCNPRVSGSIPGTSNLKKVVNLDENSWTHTSNETSFKWPSGGGTTMSAAMGLV